LIDILRDAGTSENMILEEKMAIKQMRMNLPLFFANFPALLSRPFSAGRDAPFLSSLMFRYSDDKMADQKMMLVLAPPRHPPDMNYTLTRGARISAPVPQEIWEHAIAAKTRLRRAGSGTIWC
jgi:hypothetical protein